MKSCYTRVTHLTLTLVQMIYSISSEKGFWKVKELVLIQIHSLDLERNRNITDRTWPFSFTTWRHRVQGAKQSYTCVFISNKEQVYIHTHKKCSSWKISGYKNNWTAALMDGNWRCRHTVVRERTSSLSAQILSSHIQTNIPIIETDDFTYSFSFSLTKNH